eukprot:Skav229803  [mRNA]  locus=scaffold567:256520:257925:- [translate_table: standard]
MRIKPFAAAISRACCDHFLDPLATSRDASRVQLRDEGVRAGALQQGPSAYFSETQAVKKRQRTTESMKFLLAQDSTCQARGIPSREMRAEWHGRAAGDVIRDVMCDLTGPHWTAAEKAARALTLSMLSMLQCILQCKLQCKS